MSKHMSLNRFLKELGKTKKFFAWSLEDGAMRASPKEEAFTAMFDGVEIDGPLTEALIDAVWDQLGADRACEAPFCPITALDFALSGTISHVWSAYSTKLLCKELAGQIISAADDDIEYEDVYNDDGEFVKELPDKVQMALRKKLLKAVGLREAA